MNNPPLPPQDSKASETPLQDRIRELERCLAVAVEMRDAATFIASRVKGMAEEQHARAEKAEASLTAALTALQTIERKAELGEYGIAKVAQDAIAMLEGKRHG